MAQFNLAYNKTMVSGGGYSNNPVDRGGETYREIARNHHPMWPGWAKIDALKKTTVLGPATIIADLEPDVQSFFKANYWDMIGGDFIPDQGLVNMIFDASVLCGQVFAIKTWQDTLDRVVVDTDIDGVWGKQTESATLQACHSEYFGPAKDLFKYGWLSHLVGIIRKHPEQKIFLYGWTLRVLSHC